MPHPSQMSPAETAVLVVDVQEKLMPKIHGAAALVRNMAFIIDVARLLGVEVFATVPELARRLPRPLEKLAFSSCGAPGLIDALRKNGRSRVLLVGIESHVCVLNTALDLLEEGCSVYPAVDAIGCRFALDHDVAMRRLEGAGAFLTTVESAAFEWTGGAQHPQFKAMSALVKERAKTVTG
jgi:nicotinamidase-related amidase